MTSASRAEASASRFVLLQRGWQGVGGIGTLFLLTSTLSLAEQGWYYTFLSVAAVYTVLDFGLSVLLVQISAKEFIGLSWLSGGVVAGETSSRFLALCRRVAHWYGGSAAIYLLLIPAGFVFFGGAHQTLSYGWKAAWVLTVIATCGNQLALPWPAIVEGTGRIREAYLVRLVQSIVGTTLLWVALLSGAGVYSAAVAPTTALLVSAVWLARLRPNWVAAVVSARREHYDWLTEMAPLQWRMGVSWVCGYLLIQIHVPILFRLDGPAAAAQMGLSLTIVNMLGLLAQSWVTSRLPAMTKSAATADWVEMDRTFYRGFWTALVMYACVALALILVRYLIAGWPVSDRLLPPLQFLGLMAGGFFAHLNGLLASQVRTYRRDPFVVVSIVTAAILVTAVIYAVPQWGSAGAVAAILLTNACIAFPWVLTIFMRCNHVWRSEWAGRAYG